VGFLLFGLLGFIKAGALAHGFLVEDPAFSIRQILVRGLQRHGVAELVPALGDLRGSALFGLSQEDLEVRLGSYKWIESFLIRKDLPGTLVVEITERPLLCTVRVGDRLVAMDGSGNVWPSLPTAVPLLSLDGELDPATPAVQGLVRSVKELGLGGTVVSIEPGGLRSCVMTTKDGWRLRIHLEADLEEQWERFGKARSWVAEHHPARKSLDLRWSDRVILEAADAAGVEHG